MANIYAMSDLWNDGATTFTGIGLNVTDTASGASSLLMDLQVGGVSQFLVEKNGSLVLTQAATYNAPNIRASGFETGVSFSSNTVVNLISNGIGVASFKFNAGMLLKATLPISWGNAEINGSGDTSLYRDAAGTLAQRNSTNAQTFNLYNTYTDASNYERGFMKWNSNVLEIGTEAAGTGSARDVLIRRNGVKALEFQSSYFGFYNGAGTRTLLLNTSLGQLNTLTSGRYGFGTADTVDAHIYRPAAAVIGIGGAANAGGAAEFKELTSAPAAATAAVRIYAEDDGAGKTRLMALFPTGAAQQIAIEP